MVIGDAMRYFAEALAICLGLLLWDGCKLWARRLWNRWDTWRHRRRRQHKFDPRRVARQGDER